MTEPLELPPEGGGRRRLRDLAIRLVGLGGVAAVLWLLFTRFVSWSEVTAAIDDLSARDWLLLVGVSGIRLAIEPLLLMAATPKLRWPKGFRCPGALIGFRCEVPGKDSVTFEGLSM